MKSMRKISAIVFLLFLSCHSLKAIDFKGGINWDMGAPIGKYTQFTDQFSLRGASFWLDLNIIPRLSVGVDLGFHQYYQNKERNTYYPEPGQAFTAHTYNTLNDFPLMATVKLFIVARGPVRPYIGIGAGATYLKKEIVFADMAMTEKSWSFGMAPSVGIQFTFGKLVPVGLHVFARYGVSFDEFRYSQTKLSTYQYWNVGVGLLFN